jgi:hypothetical protein
LEHPVLINLKILHLQIINEGISLEYSHRDLDVNGQGLVLDIAAGLLAGNSGWMDCFEQDDNCYPHQKPPSDLLPFV